MAAKTPKAKPKKNVPGIPTPSWMERIPVIMTLSILSIFFYIRYLFRNIPIERDEGSYAYMGHLLLNGGTPYVDFYEMKPPGLFYSYAILSGLSGGNVAWMHIWMGVLTFIGGYFTFLLARRWLDAGAAIFAALAYAALGMTAHASGFSIQAEHMVGLFAIIGLWAITKGLQEANRKWILMAGFLLCYGLLIKQNGLFFALLSIVIVPFFHYVEHRDQWIRRTFVDGGWLAAGAAIPAVIFGSILLLQGNFQDFWFWNVEYPKSYTSSITWELGRSLLESGLKKMTDELPAFWLLGGVGFLFIWLSHLSLWKKIAVSGFLLMAAISVMPGKRFYGHYFLHFFPALAMSAAATLFVLSSFVKKWVNPMMSKMLGPVVAVITLLFTFGQHSGYYFSPNYTKILRSTYGSNPFPESKLLADYLMTQKSPEDELLVLGSEPQLYAYTLADSPTRHHFMGFLLKNHPKEKEWQEEVKSDVRNNPPKYVVWVQHPLSWVPAKGADQSILNWGWSLIHQDYFPIAWYDQVSRNEVKVVEGADAKNYQASGEQYMILLERNPQQATSQGG